MSPHTQLGEVPDGVLRLLHSAVRGGLLSDVETMATAVQEAGWVRHTSGGSWHHATDPAWSVQSSDHAPNVSIFATGEHEALLRCATAVQTLIDSGEMGPVRPGGSDPDWITWSSGEAVISVNVSSPRSFGEHVVSAVLQLALERVDTPAGGLAPDPERARRLVRDGSATARWHLAGEDVLPDDVVDLLAADEDPAVRDALAANALQRRFARETS